MAKRSFAQIGAKGKPATFFIVAIFLLAALALSIFGMKIPLPGQEDLFTVHGAQDIRFGIDIRGGVEAVFIPKDYAAKPTPEELNSARSVIENRLDAKQILDREVTTDTNAGRVLVRFPWKSTETEFNPEAAIKELGEMAKLAFVGPDNVVILDGKDVRRSYAGVIQDNAGKVLPVVNLEFNDEGTRKFAEATTKFVNQIISIKMDDQILSTPTVRSAITGGKAYIEGMKDSKEAVALAEKINAGALPFALTAASSSTISPTMGRGALQVMTRAGILAFILICLFMLLYYRLPGFVAIWSLLGQITGILLAISIPQQTLTLQGIAGIILSIGMGVDANVIVSERIKEELNTGASLKTAVANGFDRAFSSVFDGNVTVAIAAIILMIFGSGSMLSFGYSLLAGVILNGLIGVTASRLMIGSLGSFRSLQKPWLFGKSQRKAAEVKANV